MREKNRRIFHDVRAFISEMKIIKKQDPLGGTSSIKLHSSHTLILHLILYYSVLN